MWKLIISNSFFNVRGKNGFTQLAQEFIKREVWLLLTFFIISSNSKTQMVAPFSKFYGKIWDVFSLTLENSFWRDFILTSTERAWVLLKIGTRDFQDSVPIERMTCFYMIITGDILHFYCFNFKISFWKRKRFFKKLVSAGVLFGADFFLCVSSIQLVS